MPKNTITPGENTALHGVDQILDLIIKACRERLDNAGYTVSAKEILGIAERGKHMAKFALKQQDAVPDMIEALGAVLLWYANEQSNFPRTEPKWISTARTALRKAGQID